MRCPDAAPECARKASDTRDTHPAQLRCTAWLLCGRGHKPRAVGSPVRRAAFGSSPRFCGSALGALRRRADGLCDGPSSILCRAFTIRQSTLFTLRRGLREGCPSCCVVHNLVRIAGLWLLTQGPRRLPVVEARANPDRPLPRTGQRAAAQWTCRSASSALRAKRRSSAACRPPHTGGGQSVRGLSEARRNRARRKKRAPAVRRRRRSATRGLFQLAAVGVHVDADGTAGADTDSRLRAARLVWRRVYQQMPRLGLSLRLRGRVAQATVVASMQYGSEARSFTQRETQRYRSFLNKVIHGIGWSPALGGTRAMEGRLTMTGLRFRVGLEDVGLQIARHQTAYLGHLPRYPELRLERSVLGALLGASGRRRRNLTTCACRP